MTFTKKSELKSLDSSITSMGNDSMLAAQSIENHAGATRHNKQEKVK